MKKERNVILPTVLSLQQALELVSIANTFKSHISLVKSGTALNGKGILGTVSLLLTMQKKDSIRLVAAGPDAESALERLNEFILFTSSNETATKKVHELTCPPMMDELSDFNANCS